MASELWSDYERSDDSRSQGERTYDFLDRVAGPFWDRVRQLLQEWVDDYCPDEQDEIVSRLQSADDIGFLAAYWELLLFQLLKRLGFEVTCHPEVEGTEKRPDFLATNDECSLYLEAKVIGEGQADVRSANRRKVVYDQLNSRVASELFYVQLEFESEGDGEIPVRAFSDAVRDWLEELDPNEVRAQVERAGPLGADPLVWEHDKSGWCVIVTPIPKSTHRETDRLVGLMDGDARCIDDRGPVRKAIERKASRYGSELGRPFIVALGVLRMFADDDDLVDALFGEEVLRFNPDDDGVPEAGRRSNGVWIGPAGPRARRLSGLLTTFEFGPWTAANTELTLWNNPWAEYPLDCDGGGLPTIRRPSGDGGLAATPATITTGEMLRLPDAWPGPEPAFPDRRTPTGPDPVDRGPDAA